MPSPTHRHLRLGEARVLNAVSTIIWNVFFSYLDLKVCVCLCGHRSNASVSADKILDLRDRQGEGGRMQFSSHLYINTQQRGSLWGLKVLPSTCLAALQLSVMISSLQILQDETSTCILRILTWWDCQKTKQGAVNQMIVGQLIKNTVIWLLEEPDWSHPNIQTQIKFSVQINQTRIFII